MQLSFRGRVVGVYVPESVMDRVPVSVILTGTVWPLVSLLGSSGVDPMSVTDVTRWRVTYWVSSVQLDTVVSTLKQMQIERGLVDFTIDHRSVSRKRRSTKTGEQVSITEWQDNVESID